MTGKEALDELLNTLKHWQGRNTIFDKMQGDCILKELDELAKYKRAFEILDDKLWIKVQELREWEKEEYKKEYELITHSTQRFITKKEYKLLEELLRKRAEMIKKWLF